MKKINLTAEGAYILGLILVTFGVFLSAKSNFGVSMVVAPAYIISQKLGVAFGYAEYILQGMLFAAFCVIVRKFKIAYMFTIVTFLLYGMTLNLWYWAFDFIECRTLMQQILFLSLGIVIIAIGIAFFFRTYLSPQSYELFVMGVSAKFKISLSKFKIIYDFSSFGIAVIMSLVLFHGLKNGDTWLIGIGTIAATVFNGVLIAGFGKIMDRLFVFDPLLKSAVKYFEY